MQFNYRSPTGPPKMALPTAQDPNAWIMTSRTLWWGAHILWERWISFMEKASIHGGGSISASEVYSYALIQPFLLLFGLAVENALKGLLVMRTPLIAKKKIKWPIAGDGHNLVELFEAANLPLSKAEAMLAGALTEAVRWGGRYPVPKNHQDLIQFGIKLGFNSEFKLNSLVEDFKQYRTSLDDLINRVGSELPNDPLDSLLSSKSPE